MRAPRVFALAAAMVAIAGVAAAAPEEPRFVRAQPFVREHLETLEAAARVAAVSPAARPALPAPCNATDSGDSVLFTWTDVAGETGYYVFRDGDLVKTLDANATQYSDHATLGVHSYCIMAFNVDGVSDVCCDQGAQTEIPPPSPCGADPDSGLIFRWTSSPGAAGYRIYRDGVLYATALPAQTSINLENSQGTSEYCVESFAGAITSTQCCASITPHIDPPQDCGFTTVAGKATYQWMSSIGAEGYNVYRDGLLYVVVPKTQTSITLSPAEGAHQFCVEAFAGAIKSSRCCATLSPQNTPATPASCSASNNLVGAIRFTWTDVDGEDGYLVSRDGSGLATVPKDSTSYVDGVAGSHHYCVRAFNAVGSSADCCSDGSSTLPSVLARLSWGTCDPQVNNQNFTGPGVYTLVLSAVGSANTNIGHDSSLRIRPAVPDAWRFDDGGCQTGARLNLQVAGVDSCPPMLGANPLAITEYSIDLDGSAMLRLAVVYDDLTTIANQRYILWKIDFDHTHSIAGTDADPATCDGASVPLNFSVVPTILISGGLALTAAMEPNDLPTFWNGGQVPTKPMTWARVKALYR